MGEAFSTELYKKKRLKLSLPRDQFWLRQVGKTFLRAGQFVRCPAINEVLDLLILQGRGKVRGSYLESGKSEHFEEKSGKIEIISHV